MVREGFLDDVPLLRSQREFRLDMLVISTSRQPSRAIPPNSSSSASRTIGSCRTGKSRQSSEPPEEAVAPYRFLRTASRVSA